VFWKKRTVSPQVVETEPDPPTGTYVLLAMFHYYNRLFGVQLERGGFVVRTCTTTASALEQMTRSRPGLVLLLVGNSDPRGLELIRAMKAQPDLATIHVLGIAEGEQSHRVPEALAAGMDTCFATPLNPRLVVDYAREVMGTAPPETDPAAGIPDPI
jgi:DNA-binding response OmpR family regulator